jgi:ferritin
MLKDKMEAALNQQINAETYSAYLYWSMAAYFQSLSLPGAAHWMECQAQEELSHAAKFYRYIVERGGRATLAAIEAPQTEWQGPLEVMEAVAAHEQKVTGLINDLMNLAAEEKDHATVSMLRWFVDEQVEEEATAQEIVDRIKLAGEKGPGLFMIDKELGGRVLASSGEDDS